MQICRLIKSRQGSYTLEAAVLIPLILLILISMVLVGMFLYQKLFLLDTVVYTAKQRANNWTNSNQQLEDGFQLKMGGDGLYWRLFDDQLLGSTSPLVARKLQLGQRFVEANLQQSPLHRKAAEISLDYTNDVLERTVQVKARDAVNLPIPWLKQRLGSTIVAEAAAEVVEPAEFIRNVDLAARYGGELASNLGDLFQRFNQAEPAEQSPQVYASTASSERLYHYANCKYISQIKAKHLRTYTETEALGQGMGLCLNCAKTRLNQ